MMAGITTVWSVPSGTADWVQLPPGLQTGSDLETAVLISLFTDAEAAGDDVIPDGSDDPRGWWGDLGSGFPIGSKLWLLSRSKATPDIPARARQYCMDALAWMVSDAVAASVDVTAEYLAATTLGITITIVQGNGQTVSFKYAWAWQGVQ